MLMFSGIGGSIGLLEPLARSMPARKVIVFDVPGVGHSPMPRLYRLRTLARWAEVFSIITGMPRRTCWASLGAARRRRGCALREHAAGD
ncbi:MAG: hypothetical protein IPG77_16270 [Betaproteobacteria bacterium]|nr:hypothetical protein [Betaproteobacteria bacterium]